MDRAIREQSYQHIKSTQHLKEYIFSTREMQRHFFVLGKDLKDAEENFMRISLLKRNGFTLADLPLRLRFDKERCKDWTMDDYLEHNENADFKPFKVR